MKISRRLQDRIGPGSRLTFRQLLLLWMGIIILPALTYLHIRYGLIWTSHTIPAASIEPYGDAPVSRGYAVRLTTGEWMNQTPVWDSPALIFEDSLPLGHGNAGLKSIAERGDGRYTLFNGEIVFSATDNSDPRANGRTYRLYWPAPIDTRLAGLLFFFGTIGTGICLHWLSARAGLPRLRQYDSSPAIQTLVLFGVWTVILFMNGWPINGRFNGVASATLVFLGLLLLHQQQTRSARWLRYPAVLLLFALPLFTLWKTGQFQYNAILGLFPWSDAGGYYAEALNLGWGVPFSGISARRPLFPALAAVVLFLTRQNLQLTLLIFCSLNATAVFLLSEKIRQRFGAVFSAMVVLLLFYDYSGYGFVGKLLTENLGLCLGAIGLLLLISGAEKHSAALLGLGSFALATALNARAGAFFALPALAVWSLALGRRGDLRSFQPFLAVLLGIFGGFACNLLLLRIVGTPGAIPFSNFGSNLFGVASGYKNWSYAYGLYPSGSESEYFRLALELIRQQPGMFLLGIVRAYQDYFRPTILFQFLYFFPESDQLLASWTLYALAVASLVRVAVQRTEIPARLLIFLVAGILASIPFVPPINEGIRAMTATIPISVVAHAYLLGRSSSPPEPTGLDWLDRSARYLVVVVLGLTLIGGASLRLLGRPPADASPPACGPGYQPARLLVAAGSYISVVRDDRIQYSFLPWIREGDFQQALRQNYLFPELSALLRSMVAGQSLLMGNDLYHPRRMFIITQTDAIQDANGPNAFCVQYAGTHDFYFEASIGQHE